MLLKVATATFLNQLESRWRVFPGEEQIFFILLVSNIFLALKRPYPAICPLYLPSIPEDAREKNQTNPTSTECYSRLQSLLAQPEN